jgi:uncharacterized integral membrane protein (TIGR00698 family)
VNPAKLAPGLALVATLTIVATLLAQVPGLKIMGPLGLALIVGIVVRSGFSLPGWARAGTSYSAKTILRLGIVLLGVRLSFSRMLEAGPLILVLDAIIVLVSIIAVERLGKLIGLSRGLRLSLAFGTGICGASAAVAAGSISNARDEEVSIAVGTVSLLGTLGVIGYITLGQALGLSSQHYGVLTGSTLQEVGQVLAAGSALGPVGADLATLTKLTRVALLAPALFIAQGILRLRDRRKLEIEGSEGQESTNQPLFPLFLLGFLSVGAVNSLGVIPSGVSGAAQQASIWLTTAAMIGIGLGVDVRVIGRVGPQALGLGAVGYGLLVVIAVIYTMLIGM